MATKSTTQRVIEVVDDTAGGMQSLTRQGAGGIKAAASAAQNLTAPAPILGEAGMDLPARGENAPPLDIEWAEMLRVLQREGLAELLRALAELDLGDAELSLESLADDMVRGRGRRGGVARAMVLSQLLQFWLQQQTPQFPKFTPAQQQQFLQIQQTAKVLSTVAALPPAQQAQRVTQILSDPKFAQNLHMAVRQISAPIATPSSRPSINVLAQTIIAQALGASRAAPIPAQAQTIVMRSINMVVLARAIVPVLANPALVNRALGAASAIAALRALQNLSPPQTPRTFNVTVTRDNPILRVVSTPSPTPQMAAQKIPAPQAAKPQVIAAIFPPRVVAAIAAVTLTASTAAATTPLPGYQPWPNVKTATPIFTTDSFMRPEVAPPAPSVPPRDPVTPPMNFTMPPIAAPRITPMADTRPVPPIAQPIKPPEKNFTARPKDPPVSAPPPKDQPPPSAPPQPAKTFDQPAKPAPIQNPTPVPAAEPKKTEAEKTDPKRPDAERNTPLQTPPASTPPTKDQASPATTPSGPTTNTPPQTPVTPPKVTIAAVSGFVTRENPVVSAPPSDKIVAPCCDPKTPAASGNAEADPFAGLDFISQHQQNQR